MSWKLKLKSALELFPAPSLQNSSSRAVKAKNKTQTKIRFTGFFFIAVANRQQRLVSLYEYLWNEKSRTNKDLNFMTCLTITKSELKLADVTVNGNLIMRFVHLWIIALWTSEKVPVLVTQETT